MDDFSYEIVVLNTPDVSASPHWELAPNPGSELLSILLTTPLSDVVTFQIFNAGGQLIKEINNHQAPRINTADWPSGIYWIRQKGSISGGAQKWVKH
jgi:hypothetical protein